jgi:hypothetical protein
VNSDLITLALVAIYCLVQVVRDFRKRTYLMAGAGIFCLVMILASPVKTHAVRTDLIVPGAR